MSSVTHIPSPSGRARLNVAQRRTLLFLRIHPDLNYLAPAGFGLQSYVWALRSCTSLSVIEPMEKLTLANKTREKQPHERTPIQRAAPVQNTVHLENVTQPHRAPFAAHTRPSTSTAAVNTVVPNAGAHAIGRRSQADGLAVPTSSHFTTFNIASPFVQIAALPSIDIPSRAETPETRIQPAIEASVADSEPMTLHWHIEEEEDAALGYQRLKCAPMSANTEGACETELVYYLHLQGK
ncbi:hypothetical protein DAEQUDRAFT_230862 [Daedalea quercina L-15889]|uniref:Uncharacterized protein n=1 Tax=Daedalea quercina L-15889 TaxID=1314783 RepID=A0A165QTJ7_9APHY|nr:hypothetical protein DAEQUDRAFT_230862 [Daedalea quercina L-15889]